MIDITPLTAKASTLAIRIAQRVLLCDRMTSMREYYEKYGGLRRFCAALAQEIDKELIEYHIDD